MKKRQKRRAKLSADIHSDDGIDPRTYFAPEKNRKADRRLQRICSQTARSIEEFFALEVGAPELQDLRVENVLGHSGSYHLTVEISAAPNPDLNRSRIESALAVLAPRIRAEFARSLQGKRTPQIAFRLIERSSE